MPVPTVSECPSPDWATDLNACLSVLDGHTHNPGQGVQITPSGMLINTDFPINGNNVTTIRSLRMTSQGAVLALVTDLGCLFNVLGDLYYNDGSGNHIRITQSGSVSGSAGTITGLPSGTASASFSGGTFTFVAATNTPAAMAVGPVSIGNSSLASKTVTLAPDVSIAANYSITFPAALPAALRYVTLDNTGALSFNSVGSTGTGAVVLASSPTIASPTFTGTAAGSIRSNTYTPTLTWSNAPASASAAGYYQVINSIAHVAIRIVVTAGGSSTYPTSITVPIAEAGTYIGSATLYVSAAGTALAGVVINAGTGVITVAPSASTMLLGAGNAGIYMIQFSYPI